MISQLDSKTSQHNFVAFLWHATFLALAQNFMDIDTIIPSMLIDSGGTSIHVGILTAIMLGGTKFAQLVFVPFLQNHSRKKPFLLTGIHLRIFSLAGLGTLLFFSSTLSNQAIIAFIFIAITIFSISGSFANINYVDILGKSMLAEKRKSFFSVRQIISSIGVLLSAFLASQVLVSSSFPKNYAYLFFIAAGALLTATAGFWRLREVETGTSKIYGFREYGKQIRTEILKNPRLGNFILLNNTLGISISLLPFLVLYAKTTTATGNAQVGQFLIFKVLGSVLAGILLASFAKRARYTLLLYVTAAFSIALPLLALLLPSSLLLILFVIGGIIFTMYRVTIDGVLLEVSSDHNRAFYTGVTGAGQLLPMLFPLAGGWIIDQLGFTWFFGIYIAIVSLAFILIQRLNCQK